MQSPGKLDTTQVQAPPYLKVLYSIDFNVAIFCLLRRLYLASHWSRTRSLSQSKPNVYEKGVNIFLHTNSSITSQCFWKSKKNPCNNNFQEAEPSAGRDTAYQDFQRGAVENAMRQEWFISVSHSPEFPDLDIILTSWLHHHNSVSAYWWSQCGLALF